MWPVLLQFLQRLVLVGVGVGVFTIRLDCLHLVSRLHQSVETAPGTLERGQLVPDGKGFHVLHQLCLGQGEVCAMRPQ